jgi:hypothetical protein
MQIAVLTFDGFNEIDSFVAAHILNRLRPKGWKAFITSPDAVVTSMNGVVVQAERRLEFVAEADAVIIGSGVKTVELVKDAPLLARIRLDPSVSLWRRNGPNRAVPPPGPRNYSRRVRSCALVPRRFACAPRATCCAGCWYQ